MTLLRDLLATALLLLCDPDNFAAAGSGGRTRDECSRDRDCHGSKVCERRGWSGRKECVSPSRHDNTCSSYTCPHGYELKSDCARIECRHECESHECCERPPPVDDVYCETFTCSFSYEFKEHYEDIVCEGECDYDECCDPVTKVEGECYHSFTCPYDYDYMEYFVDISCEGDCDTDEFCDAPGPADVCLDDTLEVILPDIPLSIQFGLLIDLSGSYSDDPVTIKSIGPELVEGLLTKEDGTERDLRLALGSFIDIPESPFGSSTDYDYRLENDFNDGTEADREAWLTALDVLTTGSGSDTPESQSIALLAAIEEWDWIDGFSKFLAITTDATFHTPEDDPRYVSVEDIINAANAKGIKIVALKAGSAGTEMDELVAGTGGSVQTTETDSSDIVAAILAGVSESVYDIVEVVSDCEEPWSVDADTAVEDISSGSIVSFDTTVCALDNTETTCNVTVVADTGVVEVFLYSVVDGEVTSDSS